jgi:uncharacterized protein (TIGR03067 family)
MRMAFVLGLAAALATVSRADDKKAALDPAKLEGTWTFVSGMKNGAKASDEGLKSTVKITKDKLTMGEGDMKFEFKYSVNAKAGPAEIDLELTSGPVGAGSKAKGLVALDGDELKLCYSPEDRPKEFSGEKAFLFVLKRKKD